MPDRVRVSARLLHWPRCCSCCLGATDAEFEAVAVRHTGVRVVRSQERSWLVPWCRRCLLHAEAQEALVEAQAYKELAEGKRRRTIIGGVAILVFLLCMPCLVAIASIAPPSEKAPHGEEKIGAKHIAGSICLALVAAPVTVLVSLLLVRKHGRAVAQAEEDIKASHADLERTYLPECACRDEPVEYLGWDGHVQTFEFASHQYARLFRHENASKIVG